MRLPAQCSVLREKNAYSEREDREPHEISGRCITYVVGV
jgi:hypothetical protein